MVKIKQSKADSLFDFANYTFLTISTLVVLYPLYFIIIASFSDPNLAYQGEIWFLPSEVTLEGYVRMFNDSKIWTGYRNSVIYAVLGTLISLVLTLPGAYALSRKDLSGRKTISFLITFTMIFSGGLIPTYMVVRSLSMVNTIWAMIIPSAVSVWNLIVARTFFQTSIPDELLEAAKIDGCSDAKFFFRIALPLSQALIAIMILYYAVGNWNAFFNALIYVRRESLYPLQLVLRDILIQNEANAEMMSDAQTVIEQQRIADLIKFGVIIAASLPLLVAYPFLQKYFVKGVMIGAVKG